MKPESFTFLPGIRCEDRLARHWLRQVTLRMRREVCWLWRERQAQGVAGLRVAVHREDLADGQRRVRRQDVALGVDDGGKGRRRQGEAHARRPALVARRHLWPGVRRGHVAQGAGHPRAVVRCALDDRREAVAALREKRPPRFPTGG